MEFVKSIFEASPIIALFLCVAVGYAIGKVRIGKFQVGGIVGTLFAAIVIGQIGVEVDAQIKTMAFALFIYSLGYHRPVLQAGCARAPDKIGGGQGRTERIGS